MIPLGGTDVRFRSPRRNKKATFYIVLDHRQAYRVSASHGMSV